ncbi:MAG: hypothetical protein AB1489_14560 [Acidobacteriota bacterium]
MKVRLSRFVLIPLATSLLVMVLFASTGWAQQEAKAKKVSNPLLDKILNDQPDTFRATQINEQGSRQQVLYARKGNLQRIETEQRGIKIIVISNPEEQKTFTLRPDKKLYAVDASGGAAFAVRRDPFNLEQTRSLAPQNVKIEDLGKENYANHPCNKYRVSFEQGTVVQKVTLWKANDLKGLIIRQELELLNIRASFELQDIELEVPAELFNLPKDYKQVAERIDMFRTENKQPGESSQ